MHAGILPFWLAFSHLRCAAGGLTHDSFQNPGVHVRSAGVPRSRRSPAAVAAAATTCNRRPALCARGITDAPVDQADAVVVQFTGVELKPTGGAAFSRDFPVPKTIDLLTLQGTTRALLLDGESVPAGEYEWMRLKVNADPAVRDSFVTIGGQECEMRIPSGAETGLKLVRGFTVGVGTVTDFTIDFDLRKSVVQPPGQRADAGTCDGQVYLLKPALRLVDNLQVGAISGTIDSSLLSAPGCVASTAKPGSVYLFGPVQATIRRRPCRTTSMGLRPTERTRSRARW